MEDVDVRSYTLGYLAGCGGKIHTSLMFRELERLKINETVYKRTLAQMITEGDLRLSEPYLKINNRK